MTDGIFKDGVYYPFGCAEEMSEGAYQAMYSCYEPDTASSLDERVGHWRTRDGRVLAIAEMEIGHLENAIRFFARAGWGDHPKIEELRGEILRRRTW